MPLSTSPLLLLASTFFGTLWVGFGINAIIRPDHALTFFELSPPTLPADKRLVDTLMVVYGVRDVFMGLAAYSATYYSSRKNLGLMWILASGVAFADGAICKWMVGAGEMNHWGYAPMLTVVGALLMGFADRK